MKKETIYCIDMDGVAARWNVHGDPHKEGYFLTPEAEEVVLEAAKILKCAGIDVVFLTKCYDRNAERDKREWLDHHGMEDFHMIGLPYKEEKSAYAPEGRHCVLLDDNTDNLFEWTDSGRTGVKFYNGINGTRHRWTGPSVRQDQRAEEIADLLLRYGYRTY